MEKDSSGAKARPVMGVNTPLLKQKIWLNVETSAKPKTSINVILVLGFPGLYNTLLVSLID